MKPFDPDLLPLLRPARRSLALGLAGGVAGGLATVAQAIALAVVVVEVVSAPSGSGWHTAAWWLVGLTALRVVASYVVDVASARAAGEVAVSLRRRILAASLAAPGDGAGAARRTGELTVLATRGVAATEPYLTRYLPTLVLAAVLPAATVLTIWWQDWLSGLIVVLTLPLIPVFAALIGLMTRDRADRQWRLLGALSGHFLDVVRGLPTLVAYRRADAQSGAIRRITERYRRATVETLKVAFLSSAVLELVATLSVALVAVSVGLRLAGGSLDFRTAMIVLLLAPEAYWPLRRVGAEFHAAAEGTAALTEISALLGGEGLAGPGFRDARSARSSTTDLDERSLMHRRAVTNAPPSGHECTGERAQMHGPLTVEGLTVTYAGRSAPALSNVNAEFPDRGLTAIVGPSGCGKSTLLAVLLGELAAEAGAVRVGAAAPEADTWRTHVAWAPQRPWLTSGTVADNLRVGRPDAPDADLWAALERVDLAELVASLPEGLATPLGEDGQRLSAGQRARIALARVVVADRPWVLLDEPTAHLDEVTEEILLDTLQWLAERSGVVVVAHREAVVDAADHVVRLPAPLPVTSAPDVAATTPPAPADPGDRAAEEADRPSRWGPRTGLLLGAGSLAFGVALTATAAWLITRASTHPPVLYLLVAIVGVRLFGLGRPVLRYVERIVTHDSALRLLAEHRAQVYDRLVPLVPCALGRRRGDVLTSVVDDVDAVVDEQLRVRQPAWTAALVCLGTAGFAAWHDLRAGAIVLTCAAIAPLVFALARRGVRRAEPAYVAHRAALSDLVEETLSGAQDLRLWQADARALDRVDAEGTALAAAVRRSARALAVARSLPALGGVVGLVAIAALVAPSYADHSATLALLLMLPIALIDVISPVADAGALSVRTAAARARLADLADRDPRVADPADPRDLPAPPTPLSTHDLAVGWGEDPAFAGLDLALAPGDRVGIVGPSGCGKSTLAAALLRFVDPATGAVRLDGADLRDLTLDDVRRTVGLVDDDPHVFASTIAENIRLARPDADDGEVLDALCAARLGEWIDALPDGVHTFVGEGHADVSGGERARLAIARAVLADAPVLVLDEPTAHLDSGTADQIAAQLLEPGERALVWITHTRVGLDRVDTVVDLSRAGAPELSPATR